MFPYRVVTEEIQWTASKLKLPNKKLHKLSRQTNSLHVEHALQWDMVRKKLLILLTPRTKFAKDSLDFFFFLPVIFLPTLKTNQPCLFS